MLAPYLGLMREQMSEIGAHIYRSNLNWFRDRGIDVLDKKEYVILNATGTKNYWNILCNGTVYTKTGLLMAMPPIEPFPLKNAGLCLMNCDLIEKVPGQQVTTFWPWIRTNVIIATKTHCSSCDAEEMQDLLKRIHAQIDFRPMNLDTSLTFIYDSKSIYLIGGRKNRDLHEYEETELDRLAKDTFSYRSERESCAQGWTTIFNKLQSSQKDYIIRDRISGERQDALLTSQKLPMTLEALIPYWLERQQRRVMIEIPETADKFLQLEHLIKGRMDVLKAIAAKYHPLRLTPGGLADSLKAAEDVPNWTISIIIKMCKEHPDNWDEVIDEEFHKMSTFKLKTNLDIQ